MSKQKPKPSRKSDINLAELKPEDFRPVSREAMGKSLKGATVKPKAGK
jgi:hypothetical protein